MSKQGEGLGHDSEREASRETAFQVHAGAARQWPVVDGGGGKRKR